MKFDRYKKFSKEQMALEVAIFKRKMDKRFGETLDIELLIEQFSTQAYICDEAKKDMDKFAELVRFFIENPNMNPDGTRRDRFDFAVEMNTNNKSQLDDIPDRAIIGGVEIFCGALICYIPFPGCRSIGLGLIAHGSDQIYEAYMKKCEKLQN